MDGWITIGVKTDKKQFKQDIEEVKKDGQQVEQNDIEVDLDTTKFDAQIDYIKSRMLEIEHQLKQADMGFDVGDTLKLESEYQKLSSQLDKLVKKQKQYNQTTKESNGLKGLLNDIKHMGRETSNNIKKIGRLALAVFGIRSAWSAVRSAMSTLSQYDDKMASNIEYIRYALASSLKPVIEALIGLAYKLLTYINYIAKAWFGVNLFANASSKSFQKAQGSTSKMAKNMKDMNKNVTALDEITNIDKKDNSDSIGGDIGGMSVPDFDLSKWDVEVPSWIKWIADHKDEVIAGLLGIAGALGMLKLGLDPIMALGIGVAVAGIAYAIEGLLKYLKNPNWENFGQIIQGIGIAVIGLGIAFFGLPAIIAGVAVLIVGTIIKYWDQIKAFLQSGIDWLVGKSDWVHNVFGDYIGEIYDFIVRTLQRILDYFNKVFTSVKTIFDGIIEFIQGVFSGNWQKALDGLKKIFSGVLDLIKAKWELIIGTIVDFFKTKIKIVGDLMTNLWNGFASGASKAWSGIKSVFSSVGSFFKNTFTNAWNSVKAVFSTGGKIFNGIKDGIVNSFKKIVNGIIDGINKAISTPFNGLNTTLKKLKNVSILGKKPFSGLISTISVPKLPHLARGGIVNNPGPGVYMGNYVAGERGAEAIVPLQNSQFIKDFAEQVANNSNNDMIIELLVDLNRNILELANRPNVVDIDGKAVAQALYKPLQNESNRINTSATISIK